MKCDYEGVNVKVWTRGYKGCGLSLRQVVCVFPHLVILLLSSLFFFSLFLCLVLSLLSLLLSHRPLLASTIPPSLVLCPSLHLHCINAEKIKCTGIHCEEASGRVSLPPGLHSSPCPRRTSPRFQRCQVHPCRRRPRHMTNVRPPLARNKHARRSVAISPRQNNKPRHSKDCRQTLSRPCNCPNQCKKRRCGRQRK